MKKLLVITLMLLMIVGMLAFCGVASAEATSGNIGTIYWKYNPNTKVLTLSGTGEIQSSESAYESTQSRPGWRYYIYDIETIVINEGITGIESYGFYCFASLKKVVLPKSLTKIGKNAFEYCNNLSEIDISNVQYIGNNAFSKTGLKSVTLSDKLEVLEYSAFAGCEQLREVTINAEIKEISSYLFQGCISLEKVVLPDSVEVIKNQAFSNCKKLKEIVIGTNLKEIGEEAFNGCLELKEISLSEGLVKIGRKAFSGCVNLRKVPLPEGLETIGEKAFENCTSLEEVVFPNSLINLEIGAYLNCSSIEKIEIPLQVKKLPKQLFSGCTSLKEVYIGDSVRSIASDVFEGSSSLRTLTMGSENELFVIYNGALYYKIYSNNNGNLTHNGEKMLYLIPEGYVGEHVVHPETIKLYYKCAFNVKGLTSIVLPNGLETIGMNAFTGSGIKKLEIPWTVRNFCYSAMFNCPDLEEIWFYGEVPHLFSIGKKYTITAKVYYPSENQGWKELLEHYYNIVEMYAFSCQEEHDIRIIEGYAATCKRLGRTDGQICNKCGAVLAEQEDIPITHRILEYNVYSNSSHSGTCDLCGEQVTSYHEFENETRICSACGYKYVDPAKKWENNIVMQFTVYATVGLVINIVIILSILSKQKKNEIY
ncbi:MAG: leucine-rich repeat protein [Clostridia bacterium]|nr:leucine-rich repeat protein [Clostridia bacterium]